MSHPVALRDRIACRLANAALRLATPWYRAMLSGAIEYGLSAAARDEEEGIPQPTSWRDLIAKEGRS